MKNRRRGLALFIKNRASEIAGFLYLDKVHFFRKGYRFLDNNEKTFLYVTLFLRKGFRF